jgi:heme oxygenase
MKFLSIEHTANKILRLTRKMRQQAEADAWQEFADLEAERQRSLEYLFQHPEIADALPALADTLRQVVSLDQESMALGEAAKRLLAEKLDMALPVPGAINAYKNTSNLV